MYDGVLAQPLLLYVAPPWLSTPLVWWLAGTWRRRCSDETHPWWLRWWASPHPTQAPPLPLSDAKKSRIATVGFGTAQQKMVLERWTNPKLSSHTCTCEYGLNSWRGESAGVASERSPTEIPHDTIRKLLHRCTHPPTSAPFTPALLSLRARPTPAGGRGAVAVVRRGARRAADGAADGPHAPHHRRIHTDCTHACTRHGAWERWRQRECT
jgi:hypothetical protein